MSIETELREVIAQSEAVARDYQTKPLLDWVPLRNRFNGDAGRFLEKHGHELLRKLAELEACRADAKDVRIELDGHQIAQLSDFTGGETDAALTIGFFDDRPPDHDGNQMPAGLWAWYSEYPDDGAIFLEPHDQARAQVKP